MLCSDDSEKSNHVRKTVKLNKEQKQTYDQAIELAKAEVGTKSADAALAAIIAWYVESRAAENAA